MFNYKLSEKLAILLGVIGFGLPIASSFVLRSQAQSNSPPTTSLNSQVSSEQVQSQAEFEPPNRGAPMRTADGGARDTRTCGEIRLLIPQTEGAMTVSDYPTFYVYVNPDTPNKQSPSISKLSVVLTDQQEQEIQPPIIIDAPSKAGVQRFQLSHNQMPALEMPALQKDQWYGLGVGAYEQENPNIYNPCNFEQAWIKRQVLTPEQQEELDRLTTPEERLNFYQHHEIWYDALATLDELRRENPHDETLKEQWRQALESIELSHFADQPPAEITPIARDTDKDTNR